MPHPTVLEPQCEWQSADLENESHWTERFSAAECQEIDSALRFALRKSSDVLDIERGDFPLPTLTGRLATIEQELINGRGFVRLRGIDRSRYSQAEMEMIYWGIGMHLGAPWPQNRHGHMLGDVTDHGRAADDPDVRGYELGSIALPFHCDGSDLVGLLCLANGMEGGLSTIANSVLIHNRLVRDEPELAAELYKPQPYDFRGEEKPGEQPWYELPVFTEWEGRLFVRCIPPYILASQRHECAPRLSPLAQAAISRVVELADDPAHHVAMALQPGDIQFINNYHVMHGRTAYSDDPMGQTKRHLKRLWLETRALESRPSYFVNQHTHWGEQRTTSRLQVN